MKAKLALTILLTIWMGVVKSQDTLRIEFEHRYNDPQPTIVPAGKLGFTILEHPREALPGVMKLLHYDTTLTQKWEEEFTFTKRLNQVDQKVFGNKLYIIFNDEYQEDLEVVVAHLITGEVRVYSLAYFSRFIISDFCVAPDGQVYIAGLLRKLPSMIRVNLEEGKIKSLPAAVDGKKVEIKNVFITKAGKVSVTITFENSGNKEVLIKEFDENDTSDDLLISPMKDYDLINGKVSHLGSNSKIVIGTYGYRNSLSTQGFYIAGYYANQEVFKKYHSFNDLENFYAFKSEREQEKIEEKIERKKTQGKELRSKYRLLIHEVMPQGEGYIMLGEAFYPTYRQQRVRRYTARGYYYETRTVFDGYRYTHAVVAAFNKKGELNWDYSFKINDIKSMDLKEHVRVNTFKDAVNLVYSLEGKMNVMTIRNGEIESKQESLKLPSKYSTDQVKYSDQGQSEFWYDNHYLAWGYQRIKYEDDAESKNRNVFYINKLSF